LQQYLGSFVVVSHNRHFVSQIANKIWYIEDQQIKEYPGTYDEYEYWRKKNAATGIKAEPPKPKKQEPEVKQKQPQTPSNEAKLKTLEKELKKAEEQIGQLETQKSKLELEMASPEVFSNAAKLKDIQASFNKTEADLAAANKKWEEVATAIDELNQ
jgi:ATP-binding cassette subfamily F protein 3